MTAPAPELCPECGQGYLAEAWQTVCDACSREELMEECGCPHDERDECVCIEECPVNSEGCPGYPGFHPVPAYDL
jgi:hypothetical protein